jgi:hypothetical protein
MPRTNSNSSTLDAVAEQIYRNMTQRTLRSRSRAASNRWWTARRRRRPIVMAPSRSCKRGRVGAGTTTPPLRDAAAAEPTGGNYNNASYRSLRSRSRSRERVAEPTLAPPNPIPARCYATRRSGSARPIIDKRPRRERTGSSQAVADQDGPSCSRMGQGRSRRDGCQGHTDCTCSRDETNIKLSVQDNNDDQVSSQVQCRTIATEIHNDERASPGTKYDVTGESQYQIIPQARRRCSTKQRKA